MQVKSLLLAAVIGLAGLSLSSCVEGGSPYGYSGYGGNYYRGGYYGGGYYSGGTVIIGGADRYRSGYRYDRYRYRNRYDDHHRDYRRSDRQHYSGRRPEYRGNGRSGNEYILPRYNKDLSR